MLLQLWRAYPFWTRLFTVVAGGTGATVGVAQAWPLVEPFLLAHRAYVRETNEEEARKLKISFEPTRTGMYDVQISIARSRRSAVNDRLITLEIEAPKSDSAPELIARRRQIEQLKDELAAIEDEIKMLRAQREKN